MSLVHFDKFIIEDRPHCFALVFISKTSGVVQELEMKDDQVSLIQRFMMGQSVTVETLDGKQHKLHQYN